MKWANLPKDQQDALLATPVYIWADDDHKEYTSEFKQHMPALHELALKGLVRPTLISYVPKFEGHDIKAALEIRRNLPPMNEDTDMVITALINIESTYLSCREMVQKSKTFIGLTNRIRRMLHEDKDYIKEMSGGADMRKVSAKHIANYFIDELETTPE